MKLFWGNHETVKSRKPRNRIQAILQDEYLKWICAFANSQGGILYIGVNDKGEVLGVDDYHRLSESIPLKIRQTMGLFCTVNVLNDEKFHYIQIVVEKYPFPVSYHGKYYKRLGSTTQELVGVELDKLILQVPRSLSRVITECCDS